MTKKGSFSIEPKAFILVNLVTADSRIIEGSIVKCLGGIHDVSYRTCGLAIRLPGAILRRGG